MEVAGEVVLERHEATPKSISNDTEIPTLTLSPFHSNQVTVAVRIGEEKTTINIMRYSMSVTYLKASMREVSDTVERSVNTLSNS